MAQSDWIKLLVPLVGNLLISSFVAVYIKGIIDKGFKRQEKRSQYMVVVMSDLNNHLLKLKNLIIHLQSGLSEDKEADFKSLFIVGGDIQSYIENYEVYFKQIEEREHKDIFAINDLKYLLQQFYICGKAMKQSKYEDDAAIDFRCAVDEIRKICITIIQRYNAVLSNC